MTTSAAAGRPNGAMSLPRRAQDIDFHVAARMRERRMLLGLTQPDIAQIAFVLGVDGGPRRVVRQPGTRQSCGHGRRGRCETSPQLCPANSGGLYRPSVHDPPLVHWPLGRSMLRSGHATATGGPRSRSIRRKIAANSIRGIATSASWKTM